LSTAHGVFGCLYAPGLLTFAPGSPRATLTIRRVWLGVLALSAVCGALLITQGLLPADSTLNERDFVQEYLLARAILDRVDPYQPIQTLAARYSESSGFFEKTDPTPHPPTVGLLALPLGLVSYPVAARAWFGFELVCLVGAVAILVRVTGLPMPLRTVPFLAVALIAWPPVTLEIRLGQLMVP
jgi:hypothetical protein